LDNNLRKNRFLKFYIKTFNKNLNLSIRKHFKLTKHKDFMPRLYKNSELASEYFRKYGVGGNFNTVMEEARVIRRCRQSIHVHYIKKKELKGLNFGITFGKTQLKQLETVLIESID